MDTQQNGLQAINQSTLTSLVRKAVSNDTADVTTWTYQPIYSGAGEVVESQWGTPGVSVVIQPHELI